MRPEFLDTNEYLLRLWWPRRSNCHRVCIFKLIKQPEETEKQQRRRRIGSNKENWEQRTKNTMWRKIKARKGGADWKAGKWKDRTKQQSKETVKETKRQQWERDEHRQSSCISSCRLRGSDQCLIITSTLTACWDSSAPSCILLPPLHWHNPSSCGANAGRGAGNARKLGFSEVKCEILRVFTSFHHIQRNANPIHF